MRLVKLLDSWPVLCVRLSACVATILLIAVTLFGGQVPTPNEIYDLTVEHRLSSLEEKVSGISDRLRDMNEKDWVIMLGILGLTGETGLRIAKSKSRKS